MYCTHTCIKLLAMRGTGRHTIIVYVYVYVAVPGRNWTLFRCVFQSYYHIRSAVTQYYCGWSSYTLCKLINAYHVYTVRMSLTPNGSSALQHFEHGNVIKICNGILFNFYPVLPHTCIWSPDAMKFHREYTCICYVLTNMMIKHSAGPDIPGRLWARA